MRTLDWLVLLVSLVGIAGYGLYKARGRATMQSYLLAGKTMSWWVIGLSIMATQASAITFIGTTGQGYTDGIRFVQYYFGLPIALVVISAVAVPLFHRSGVYTAYEYLERRFDPKTRTLTSIVFLIERGLGVGLALYAPAVVLSVILGWPESVTVWAMGALVILYTVIGGIKAVMWTDAQQMFVMFAGIVVAFIAAGWGLPSGVSFSDGLYLSGVAGKLRAVDLSFDWQNRYNLWSGLIGGSFLALAYFGTDQSQVQRYLTGRSIAHMRFSLLFNSVVKVPLQFVILLTGAMVFSFFLFVKPPLLFNNVDRQQIESAGDPAFAAVTARYDEAFAERREAARGLAETHTTAAQRRFRDADQTVQQARRDAISLVEARKGETYNDTNYIFLTFVMRHLPVGIVGLIIAAVFAAAMSTISAELNSLAAVTIVDHYQRYLNKGRSDAHYASAARWATAFWGLYAATFASFGGQLGSLIEAVNIVGSLFYGSMLGVFVLAFAPWRSNGHGAFAGMLAGLAAVAWISRNSGVSFLWHNVVGCIVAVVVGLLVSRMFPTPQRA